MAFVVFGLVLIAGLTAGVRLARNAAVGGASSFSSASVGDSGFFFPQQQFFTPDFNNLYQQWLFQMQQAQLANRMAINQFGYQSNAVNPEAFSGVSFGPSGGFGQAGVGPEGLGVRIASAEFSPPGQSFGTFSSSNVKETVDANGQRTVHRESTVGVNDNGKITVKKVSD